MKGPANKTVTVLEKMEGVTGPLATKQKQGNSTGMSKNIKPHPIRFSLLVDVYEDNFIVGGALDKVATACSTGFVPIKVKEGDKTKAVKLQELLNSLSADLEYYFLSLLVTGNSFAEIALDGEKMPHLLPCLTPEMYLKLEATDVKIEGEKDKYKVIEKKYVQLAGETMLSVSGDGQVEFLSTEMIHRKTVSLSNRYYGVSKFAKVSQQIATLTAIDRYYADLFDRGLLSVSILCDKERKLTEAQKATIKNIIDDQLRGQGNSYKSVIVPGVIEKLDLSKDEDTKAFLEYRDKLIRSIAIGLNVPYDLLDSINSNRSTSEVAKEQLNQDIVLPLHSRFISVLRDALRPYYDTLVEYIELRTPDTKNELDDMKVKTGYKTSGILTANEIREELGYDPIDGGDILQTSGGSKAETDAEAKKEIDAINNLLSKFYTPEILEKVKKNV
jgi:HK97 family phage portal protein